jgi:amino acid adenylation domain-containing protein
VLARTLAGEDAARLVAWVLPQEKGLGTAETADLRAWLAEQLPEYMIPAAFVTLAALPLSPNGKLDVRALPEPAAAPEKEKAELPRTPLEQEIAALWAEVLGSGSFGIHDNFFELGGDSIKGAILIHRLQRRLEVELSVMTLFDAPTVAGLAARLDQTLVEEETAPIAPRRLAPVERQDWSFEAPPLSFAQERLWFLHLLDPAGSVYNMPNAFRLHGPLDVSALAGALREVVRRHAVLRTRYETHEGLPVPVVEPAPDSVLPVADLSALPAALREDEARRIADSEAARPFDLAGLNGGPVVRHLLLRLSPEEHGISFVAHHIACDGWSMGLWAREVEALYTAFATGRPSPLAEPPVQYADFAAWQRGWLAGEELAVQLGYWRERLAGAPPFLDLPADHPRPPLQTFRGEWEILPVPAALAAELRALGQTHNASLFMVLLAGFQLLLSRWSGQEDVLVGSPIAGRVPEVENLIGCFLNTLVLRTDLSGAPSFAELLGRVRQTALGAFANQDVPFEKLLEELRPERDLSRNSLFQVLFNMLNAPAADITLPGTEIEGQSLTEAAAKFDLTLYVAESGGDLLFNLVYNADLFDRPRMQEMLRQYRSLLEQAVAAPEAAVAGYSLLTPEAAAVLPDPAAELPGRWEGTVHDLFAEWALRRPEKPALIDREGRDGLWTYGELSAAVDRLAARLLASGIQPGDRVAIYAHRSAALAWAILGVLRAGAAFVILDPIYPGSRLVEVLRLAGPRGWLRLEAAGPLPEPLAGVVAETPFAFRLGVPAGGLSAATAAVGDPALPTSWPVLGPDDVASHAFTSGSTGVPKGIVQTHGSMSYFLPWHRDVLGYGESDRHTMLSGLAHDPLQRDVFYCLGSGATLCVPDPGRIGEPGYLAGWMRRERVTVTNMTPAMAQLATELPEGTSTIELPDLRCAVLAGDILTRLDVDRVRRLAPRARLVNVYGSTESHRALSYHLIGDEDERGKQVLPLGRGQRGCQLLVLNRAGGRAGVGELGEVAIRSRHLAAGYLGDEALTRERFVLNPFTGETGDRLYRTGDLGRYRPDGEVEAAGRADQQVKIRGYRVEPGEIEAELGRIPGVKEAVVVGKDDGAGGKRLVAYIVPEHGFLDPAVGETELRELLRECLPAYMVPAVFVQLEKLPLNANGKVDRRALPAPQLAAAPAERRHVPPRDDLERRLARIWAEVMATGPVSVTDNFFDLGGHSLLAVRLMARIAGELEVSLPLAALFQAPTVKEMAALLRRREAHAEEQPLVTLRSGGELPPLFLVHPAGGQVFCYADLVRELAPGQPVYGLQDTEPAGAKRTLAGLAARYLREVRAVQPSGPYLLAGWSFGGRVAWEMARQLTAAREEVALVAMLDTGLVAPPASDTGDAELLAEVLGDLPLSLAELRRAADPLAALLARARETGSLPEGLTDEGARRLFDVFKAHLEVARTDRPQPYRGRVVFFAAAEQPWETLADPAHGWDRLAGDLELRRVPGDHVTMVRDPRNVKALARALTAAIEEAVGALAR